MDNEIEVIREQAIKSRLLQEGIGDIYMGKLTHPNEIITAL